METTVLMRLENALNCVRIKAPVFSLFIVHIAQPINYPIIDQNVIRAYNYLSKRNKSEVKPRNFLDSV